MPDVDVDALLAEAPPEEPVVQEETPVVEEPPAPEPEAQPEPAQPEPEPAPAPEPEPEINLDEFKVEDLPDDYEPKSWKEAIAIAEDRAIKRMKAEEAQKVVAKREEDKANDAALKEVQAAYDAEITQLTQSDRLPKDQEGNMKRQEEVWAFMNAENQRRHAAGSKFFINSFEDALERLELREMKAAAAARENQEAEDRKTRGGMIAGGSGAKVPTNPTAGLRSGMSLDDILEQEGI